MFRCRDKKETCLYKLGNKHGLIDTLFPANGFGVCKQILIKLMMLIYQKL
jgi:hypothetical protein